MTLKHLDFMFWFSGTIALFDGMASVVCSTVSELRDLTGLFVMCSLLMFFGSLTYYLRAKELEKKGLDSEE